MIIIKILYKDELDKMAMVNSVVKEFVMKSNEEITVEEIKIILKILNKIV